MVKTVITPITAAILAAILDFSESSRVIPPHPLDSYSGPSYLSKNAIKWFPQNFEGYLGLATGLVPLWRHKQSCVTSSAERKQSEWDMGTMCKNHRFIVSYGFVTSCNKWKNVCARVANFFFHSREGYSDVYFPSGVFYIYYCMM